MPGTTRGSAAPGRVRGGYGGPGPYVPCQMPRPRCMHCTARPCAVCGRRWDRPALPTQLGGRCRRVRKQKGNFGTGGGVGANSEAGTFLKRPAPAANVRETTVRSAHQAKRRSPPRAGAAVHTVCLHHDVWCGASHHESWLSLKRLPEWRVPRAGERTTGGVALGIRPELMQSCGSSGGQVGMMGSTPPALFSSF